MTTPVALQGIHAPNLLKQVERWQAMGGQASVAIPGIAGRVRERGRVSRVRATARRANAGAEVYAILATLFLVAGYLAVAAGTHSGPFTTEAAPSRAIAVFVAPGDTLWSLSRQYFSAGDSMDRRLDSIRDLNPGLNTAAPLQPGQRILLPCGAGAAGCAPLPSVAANAGRVHRRHARHRRSAPASGIVLGS